MSHQFGKAFFLVSLLSAPSFPCGKYGAENLGLSRQNSPIHKAIASTIKIPPLIENATQSYNERAVCPEDGVGATGAECGVKGKMTRQVGGDILNARTAAEINA